MSRENEIENFNVDKLTSILFFRTQIYSIIRDIFLFEPSREYLQKLLQHKVLKMISEAYPEECLRVSSAEFLRAVKELLDGGDVMLMETWSEYARLFIGPAPPIVLPYESFHREIGRERRFKGEVWMEVKEWFLDDGFILEDHGVLEDHAGIEFEYMMLTTIKAGELLKEGDRDAILNVLMRQKKFLEEHLKEWIPKLCTEIEEKSKSSFYKSFAKFTRDFLEEDLTLLNELILSLIGGGRNQI